MHDRTSQIYCTNTCTPVMHFYVDCGSNAANSCDEAGESSSDIGYCYFDGGTGNTNQYWCQHKDETSAASPSCTVGNECTSSDLAENCLTSLHGVFIGGEYFDP